MQRIIIVFSFNINGEVKVLDNLNVTGRVYYSNTRTHSSPFGTDVSFFRNASLAPTAKIILRMDHMLPVRNGG